MSNFFSKFNVRLLVIHFAAFWLFVYAFQTLSFLYDYKFLFVLPPVSRNNEAARFSSDMNVINESGFIGLIIAYVISWRISLNRNWFWANSVLIFLAVYGLKRMGLLGWGVLQNVFLAPGHLFTVNSVASFITNGVFMLALGSLLLFLNSIKQFIDKGNAADKKVYPVGKARSN
ncbi:hypothetical protein [Mucilaginibacter sp.]|uniref:hypothetical protein n=1 Tax=Mucilaginibacter sp. TaxID=1882438 RepID=UPI003D10B607